jgi:hypothetical protein
VFGGLGCVRVYGSHAVHLGDEATLSFAPNEKVYPLFWFVRVVFYMPFFCIFWGQLFMCLFFKSGPAVLSIQERIEDTESDVASGEPHDSLSFLGKVMQTHEISKHVAIRPQTCILGLGVGEPWNIGPLRRLR